MRLASSGFAWAACSPCCSPHAKEIAAVAVPFYGYAAGEGEPDWSGLTAVVRGQMAEDDGFFPAPGGAELVQRLTSMGKDVAFTVYPGTQHAFANDANSIGTYDPVAAEAAWTACLAALRAHLPL